MMNDILTVTIPKTEYDKLLAENAELTQKVEWLMEQFWLAKHRQFGVSSEKSEYDQMSLFNEAEVTADINVIEPDLVEVEKHYRKRKRSAKERLPEDIPVEVIEHELPADEQICAECGGCLHIMGRDSRRELVIIPAQVKIREHISKVYSCRNCDNTSDHTPIVKAALPAPVIKGSFASAEAIAHIMTQKFVMGVPLYRQEQEWNRQGIMLSRQTMSNWLIRAAEDWLEPVYDAFREMLLTEPVLHADETTLQVLNEADKTPQSKSYMWLYRTSRYDSRSKEIKRPIVVYEYQPDRKAKRPLDFLADFKGYLHADGYDGYHSLPECIIVVGCWAHARRKFDEALKITPESARKGSNILRGKRYCDRLFEFERQFADMTPEERFKKRQELSKPVMDEFFAWLDSLNALPKTPIGAAAQYVLGQRIYLQRYLDDGRLEISNNRAERSIKPFVISRKNFLFANTPRGAKASAVMFSLIETAKESGLNPFAYLSYIFHNAPNWDIRNNRDMLNLLMPWFVPDSCKAFR